MSCNFTLLLRSFYIILKILYLFFCNNLTCSFCCHFRLRMRTGLQSFKYAHKLMKKQLKCMQTESSHSYRLSSRFQRILDLINFSDATSNENSSHHKQTVSVADIGGDHGILTSHIAFNARNVFNNVRQANPNINMMNKIVYVDQSYLATQKAKQYFEKLNGFISDNIIVQVGNGLQPLLDLNINSCHSIVMAGMGCNSVQDIINHESIIFNENCTVSDSKSKQLSLLTLNVQDIIIQPYPPNLISLLQIIYSLQKYGWTLQQQYIDQFDNRRWFHMTMKFSKNHAANTDKIIVDHNDHVINHNLVSIFKNMHLTCATSDCGNGNKINYSNSTQKIVWKLYLEKQLVTLNKIISHYETNCNVANSNNSYYEIYKELQKAIHENIYYMNSSKFIDI